MFHLLELATVGWALATLGAAGPGDTLLGSSFGTARDATYDYVVVGGGIGGLTMATRLAEGGANSVAVIEAGSFYEIGNSNLSQVPAYCVFFTGHSEEDVNPQIDWGFFTTEQEGFNGESLHYTNGKTLGGGSARNFYTYHRGTEGSYKQWAEDVGDDSYLWENFLPYFQKSINFTPPNNEVRAANATPNYDAAALGTKKGPVSVTYGNYAQPFSSWAEKGLAEIGIEPVDGFNSGSLNGSAYLTSTNNATDQIRESSETSYFQKIGLHETRLVTYVNTLAKKINFDSSKKATGVQVDFAGRALTISANKEVIVSAGAFQSPHLLMVSGIGPAASLEKHGIEVIADRPGVGQNMWDHVLGGPSYAVNLDTASQLGNPEYVAAATEEFIEKRTGPLTNFAADMLAWEKIPDSYRGNFSNSTRGELATKFSKDWPEVEYIMTSAYWGSQNGTQPPLSAGNMATVLVALAAPLSRGTVEISSADMADPPIINPRWLTHKADQEVAIAGWKRARSVFTSDALKDIIIGDEFFPGSSVDTDEEILDQIREGFSPVYHASCTCKMGKESDPDAVVDSKARVIGVQNLRVVDSSAMALLPPGHPQSTIYALAEKIAAEILQNN